MGTEPPAAPPSPIAYPSGLPWGRVEGRIARAYADNTDPDRLPDLVAASTVRVTFTPMVRAVTYTGEGGPIIITPEETVCDIDNEGYLVGPDGQRGVTLLATSGAGMSPTGWAYTVTFTGAMLPSMRVSVAASQTVNLATVVPADPAATVVEAPDPATLAAVRSLSQDVARLLEAPAYAGKITADRLTGGTFDPAFIRALMSAPGMSWPRTEVPVETGTGYAPYGNNKCYVYRSGPLVQLSAVYTTTSEWKDGATLLRLPEWARPADVQYQTTYEGYRFVVLLNGEVKLYTPAAANISDGRRITATWFART